MDFSDQIKQFIETIEKIKPNVQTEEATKHSMVMPLLQILGYNVFDPTEVIPEFIADLGIKKGEKVDYAIKIGQEPLILYIFEQEATHCIRYALPSSTNLTEEALGKGGQDVEGKEL